MKIPWSSNYDMAMAHTKYGLYDDDDFIGMAAGLQTKYTVNCKRRKNNTKISNYSVN